MARAVVSTDRRESSGASCRLAFEVAAIILSDNSRVNLFHLVSRTSCLARGGYLMTQVLGVDIGSSSIKGCVLDLEHDRLGPVRQIPFPDPVAGLPPMHHEVVPQEVLSRVQELLAELSGESPGAGHVLFSSQMGGLVLTTQRGEATGNYISWRDQRLLAPSTQDVRSTATDLTCWDVFRRQVTAEDLDRNGRELQPGSTISLVSWLSDRGLLPSHPCLAMPLGDYIVSQLCGVEPRSEPTLALGFVDFQAMQPCDEWLQRVAGPTVSWPRLAGRHEILGHCEIAGRTLACFPAMGDHQAALTGVGLQSRELSINVSTGSQVSLLTNELRLGNYQTRPFGDGRFLNTLTHLPAGRALNGLLDLLGELPRHEGYTLRDPWTVIEREVARVRGERRSGATGDPLELHLSFFAGPLGDEGRVEHLRLENLTVGHWFHAAFERMAENYAVCAARLSEPGSYDRVALSGGLIQRLPSLRAMITEQFACPHRLIELEEESLRGLLVSARDRLRERALLQK
jgi:sugar (pentulose or hexulose) kinase